MTIKDTLKHLFSEKIKGIIWKIVLDDKNELLFIESRTADKEVFFYVYDFLSDKFLVKEKTFEGNWFTAISGAYEGIAYFHGLENEFSPARKGLLAYDVYQNKVLWENYNYSLEYISQNGLIVFNQRIHPKKFELLDNTSGMLIKKLNQDDLNNHIPVTNQIAIPQMKLGDKITDVTQTLSIEKNTFKTLYKSENNKFNQYICVFSDDVLIFEDCLNTDIQKIASDTFFVWLNRLIYIRDKSEIVSYLV